MWIRERDSELKVNSRNRSRIQSLFAKKIVNSKWIQDTKSEILSHTSNHLFPPCRLAREINKIPDSKYWPIRRWKIEMIRRVVTNPLLNSMNLNSLSISRIYLVFTIFFANSLWSTSYFANSLWNHYNSANSLLIHYLFRKFVFNSLSFSQIHF